jgi:starvation-inducible DNA-binding protein
MWKRTVLSKANAKKVSDALQPTLVHLIDLALIAKQAHWCVFGTHFLAVHEKLDEVVASARAASDQVAERMSQVGICPDGRSDTVAAGSKLEAFPAGFHSDVQVLGEFCDRLLAVCKALRTAREAVEDADPYTEDMLIAIGQGLEEHLWMLQAMEGESPKNK